MYKHLSQRVLSLFVVLTLLAQMLPAQILAVEESSTAEVSVPTENTAVQPAPDNAHIVREVTENRTESTKQYLLSNGLYMAVAYPEAVHYQQDGQWKDIDNTLTRSGTAYTNTAGGWEVSLPGQLSADHAVSVTKDGHTLRFRLAGELRGSGDVSAFSVTAEDQSLQIRSAEASDAQVKKIDLAEAKAAAEHPETVSEKLRSRLQYADVYPGTDIIYDLSSNQLKESIVIESYSEELRGYRYTLETGQLTPVLNSDGSISLFAPDGREPVLYMPAPYLVDDAGALSGDVTVELTGKDGTYILTYLPDTQWLASEERQWPVILDPVVTAESNALTIEDVTIFERNSMSDYTGVSLAVGNTYSYGVSRAFLKYKDDALPAITSSDVVIGASLALYQITAVSASVVEAHKVGGTWTSSTINWSNQPQIDTVVEDFVEVSAAGYYNMDITDIVREWYASQNTGLAITMPKSVEDGSESVHFQAQFYSSDRSIYTAPTAYIIFRNNNGLESYWDYTSSSAGRAGTGFVNNYTGNLVWTHSDIGFGGNRMPVSVSHVYNLNDVITPSDSNNSNDSGGNSFGMGMGWRTNFNQLLYRWQLDGTNTEYYVWEDADGTDHYFTGDSSGVLRDEDGLELTLTTNGTGVTTYCIQDKYGNCTYFDSYGRLSRIYNYQQYLSYINITYTTASGRLISTVTDGAGRVYSFSYTNGLLSRISYLGTGSTALSYVDYTYSGSLLTRATYKDGKYSSYTYNAQNLLTSAQDIDGYKLAYTYNTVSASWQPYRVLNVTESHNGTVGGSLTFAYGHNQTTLTDHNGSKTILQFNNFGNLTCIQDDEGRAQFAQYAFNTDAEKASPTDSTQKGNQLRLSSDLQYTVANLLGDNNTHFTSLGWTCVSSTKVLTTDRCYADSSALKVTTTAGNGGVRSAGFTLAPGKTHTFTCYVASDAVSVYLQAESGSTTVKSQYQALDDEWYRLQVSYTNTAASACTVYYSVRAVGVGTFYMDCPQLELAPTSSPYNLMNSGDFNYDFNANQWVGSNLASGDGITTISGSAVPQLDNRVVKITGSPTVQKAVTQTVLLDGNPGDYLSLAGWAKGNSAALKEGREFALQAVILYADNTRSEPFVAQFNPDSNDWQFAATPIFAEKDFWKIEVSLLYYNNVNTVYFDGIQLLRVGLGDALEYDSSGNVISVLNADGRKDTYQYTSNNLTKEILSTGAELSYTYDNYHNVKTATTEEGLVYSFTYDGYGNNTAVSITDGSTTMTSTATYSSDGNRLSSTRDAMGNTTTYGYNANTNVLEWVQYPEDTEATRTNYTYDSMYRLSGAAATTDTGKAMGVGYTYSNDLLSTVTTPSTTYSFHYGSFGLASSVKIGTRTLASYSYTADRNFYLSALDYGNEDRVQYSYDDRGRVLSATYEDGDTVHYSYDNSGTLATVTDSASGIKATYGYDYVGRLSVYEEQGGDNSLTLDYSYYVSNKQLKTLREVINGHVRGASYIYDDDTRLTSYQKANGKRAYTYDGFDRVSGYTTTYENGGSFGTVLTTGFTFASSAVSTTSGRVSGLRQTASGFDTTYSYTYDANGNILSVSDGTNTTSYVYDSANQLVRENNQAGGFTHIWVYDNAGNIQSRSEYAYTTGTIGEALDTVVYNYGGSQWGDLLTGYDGRDITSDTIGNMLSDGVRSYTWEHGRELATVTQNGVTWQNTYNADGLRTKRAGGSNTYEYVYYGGSLQYMEYNGQAVYFTHAPDGTPMGMLTEGNAYFYITNLQGDVVAILNSSGQVVVQYTYDAWGNLLSTTGSLASTIGALNPIRYRGYVYDPETGLYYLQSRYYDPEIGRFINADAFVSTGQGLTGNNMFAYCGNNPVTYEDDSGGMRKPCTVAINDGAPSGVLFLPKPPIRSQYDSEIADKPVGIAPVSHAGCGPVAACNALRELGEDVSLDDVLNYYNCHVHQMLLAGAAGTTPFAMQDYFEACGYTALMTNDPDLIDAYSRKADACVMYYMFPDNNPLGVGAHFVWYRRDGIGYIGYNVSANNPVVKFESPSEFGDRENRYGLIGIFVFK